MTMQNHLLQLSEFTKAYIATALWSSSASGVSEGDDYETLDAFGMHDIDAATLAVMVADCEKFQADNAADLADENCLRCGPDYGPAGHAGHDFWLTRNGHGAGFWDGDWQEPAATRLTAAAEAFGDFHFWVKDGVISGEQI